MYLETLQDSISLAKEQDAAFFSGTVTRDDFLHSAQHVLAHLKKDIEKIAAAESVLFPSLKNGSLGKEAGRNLGDTFRSWRQSPPSITALICFSAEKFGIQPDSNMLRAALLTAIAADVPNNNAYHSRHHSREVVFSIARLLHAQNQMPGEVHLDAENAAKCLAAAAGHDLLHDGKSNGGIQYRLEDQSFNAMSPFLALMQVAEKDRQDIHVMIKGTDISTTPGKVSPQMLLKRSYNGEQVILADGMTAAAADKKLLTMAALLGDADLTPSGATDFAFSRMMNTNVNRETPAVLDTPQETANFIRFVIGGKFTTAAAQSVGQQSLSEVYAQLQNIIQAPKPGHS